MITSTCEQCGRTFPTKHGLSMHLARAHRPPPSLQADQIFERLGNATNALFPDGIPASRVIEIAEWQRATLKLLDR